MSPAPIYPISELKGSVGVWIVKGVTVAHINRFSPDEFINNIEKYK